MTNIIEFLKNFEILIGTFTAVFIATIVSINKIIPMVANLFSLLSKKQAKEHTKNELNNIKAELNEIKAVITVLNENFQRVENDFFVIKQNFIPINAYIKEKAVFSKLKNEIENRRKYYITEVKNLESPFKSMIIEGCNESYYFFKSIRENGYQNIDSNVITDSAIQIFRRIRSGHGGNINIDKEFKDHIKTNVAMPLIFELNGRLSKLKSGFFDGSEADVKIGKYNGGSDKELINIAIWFIDSIISQSINFLNKK